MRVISGIFKGKSITFLKSKITRPLKDSVKENIFNILSHSNSIGVKIVNSNVLDLYSGIGSFGIECISRGARKVSFIEQDFLANDVLKKNLDKLSILEKSAIYNNTIENVLLDIKEKFNVFFFDPPFADSKFIKNIELIRERKIFSSSHVLIVHREKKTNEDFQKIFKTIDTKQYGRSKIIFGKFT